MRPVTFVCTFKEEDEESGIKMREIGLEGEKEEEEEEGRRTPKLGRAGTTTQRVRRHAGGLENVILWGGWNARMMHVVGNGMGCVLPYVSSFSPTPFPPHTPLLFRVHRL
jgi:hypothetical protein